MWLRVSSCLWSGGMITVASSGVFPLQFLWQKSLDSIAREVSCIVFSSSMITAPDRHTTKEKDSFISVSSRQCLSWITGQRIRTYGLQGQSKGPQKPPFHPFPALSIGVLFTNRGPHLSQNSDPADIHSYLNKDPDTPVMTGLVPGPLMPCSGIF